MLKRVNIILIIVVFGMFLLPEQSFACAMHSKETVKVEKSCCSTENQQQEMEKQQSEHNADKDCCKTEHEDHNQCTGRCGTQSCHPTTFSFSATPPIFRNVQCGFSFKNKKAYPLYVQNSYSLRE